MQCFARYVSALETGSMAARTEHERAWYEQQAQRLNKRVQPLMLWWTQAYKVMPCKCMPLRLLITLPLHSCHCNRGVLGML